MFGRTTLEYSWYSTCSESLRDYSHEACFLPIRLNDRECRRLPVVFA